MPMTNGEEEQSKDEYNKGSHDVADVADAVDVDDLESCLDKDSEDEEEEREVEEKAEEDYRWPFDLELEWG